MKATAVIVARGEGAVSPLTHLGGLSLLKRAVLTAQRAGATTCYLLVEEKDEHALRSEVTGDGRITARVVWVRAEAAVTAGEEKRGETHCLVFAVNAVFRHPFIIEVMRGVPPTGSPIVINVNGIPVIAVVPAVWTAQMATDLARGKSLPEATLLARGGCVQTVEASARLCFRVTDRRSVARAERALLLSLENARDGVVDTYFNRKLSRPISRWLLRTPLSPNQITVFSCSVGLLGALCFFPGGYWGPVIGALLLQFAAVLDCCDGEIARVKFMESPFCNWLDIFCDTIVHLAVFLGIGVAIWRDGASHQALALAGVLALGGALAFPLVTLAEKTEEMGERRGGWEDVWIKKLLATLTTRDFSVLIIAGAVFGKLHWFLWGAAVGAQVFWLVLAWLLFRAGRFMRIRGAGGKKET